MENLNPAPQPTSRIFIPGDIPKLWSKRIVIGRRIAAWIPSRRISIGECPRA
jgi:hypothetical protein